MGYFKNGLVTMVVVIVSILWIIPAIAKAFEKK